jgi:hypothetical protein
LIHVHDNAFQGRFQLQMARGRQALVSYTLATSSDLGSTDSGNPAGLNDTTAASVSQIVVPQLTPFDFDIRHSICGAVSYEIPEPAWGRVENAILKGWAVDGLLRISSAPPLKCTNRGRYALKTASDPRRLFEQRLTREQHCP